jgi:hypothetical protein
VTSRDGRTAPARAAPSPDVQKKYSAEYGTAAWSPGVHVPAGATPPEVFRRCTYVIPPRRSPVFATACSRRSGMFPAPPSVAALRAASTELPSLSIQTGRPVAKLRKWLPISFGTPVVLNSVASGSVKSHVPFAWQVYFCTPAASATKASLLPGS